MSSRLGAGQWVKDSKDLESILEPIHGNEANTAEVPRKINDKTHYLVANIRQRLLDGYYDNQTKIYVDTVHMREYNELKHGKIVGISLGNGNEKQIAIHDQGIAKNREIIEDNFHGVPGKIHILLERINGDIESLYIGDIRDIHSSITDKVSQPIPSIVEETVIYDFIQQNQAKGEEPEWLQAYSI